MDDPVGVAHEYERPEITVLGSVADITQQNFSNNTPDFNFFGITLTGTS